MSSHRTRPSRPRLIIPNRRKDVNLDSAPNLIGGTLSPDLQPNSPPTFPSGDDVIQNCKIGKYLLISPVDKVGCIQVFKAFHLETQEELICKVIPLEKYRAVLAAYWRIGSHDHISEIEEILLGKTRAYVFFPRHYGDLHSYVRNKRRLKESVAVRLYEQIVSAVSHCHDNGVVLRDLKLRKFVFKDAERTELKLEGLEDACVLQDGNDNLADKHGCPAYVSPEILNANQYYSGRAADTWSLGVMLYTVLVGRYPFHDVEPTALFTKIRRGQYSIPDTVSSRAKCLIRSLLRRDPKERLNAAEILQHPWLNVAPKPHLSSSKKEKELDQTVPDIGIQEEDSFFS